MRREEVIGAKIRNTWKDSWKIFLDSCEYTIFNNLSFVKGVLLSREHPIAHKDVNIITEELQFYLESLGYKNVISYGHSSFYTLKGHESGLVFIVFLSTAAIKAYLKENEIWAKSIQSRSRFDKEAARPYDEQIRYLDIYKEIRKK